MTNKQSRCDLRRAIEEAAIAFNHCDFEDEHDMAPDAKVKREAALQALKAAVYNVEHG